MAGERDDDGSITLNVDDLDLIEVPVDPAIAAEGEKTGAKTAKEPKPRTRRVSPEIDDQGIVKQPNTQAAQQVATGPSPEEALKQAQEALKSQEEARKAAEATANAERARREAAERGQQEAARLAEESAQRADDTQLTLIESNITAAQRELDDQRDAYTRAAEAGEFSKMADIQIKISKAAAALDRWEDTKAGHEARRATQAPTEGRVTAPAPASNATEQFLSGFAPQAQTWLRQHMDCLPAQYGGSATKNNQMMQGHYAALAKGLQEGSEAYFNVIEEAIGARQPVVAQQPEPAPVSRAAETVPARGEPAPSAPPTRDAPAAGGQPQPRSVREVRLTKDQQEMAKLSFPHLPEQQAFGMYARNLIDLEAEGKIGRSTH